MTYNSMGTQLPDSKRPRLLKDFLTDNSHSHSNKVSNIFVNAVKYLRFTSVKCPLILTRRISRRLSRRNKYKNNDDVRDLSVVTVKVKDILRWRSFRDAVDEESQPLDFSSSPHRCTTTTTTTGSTSSSSSWCDSDFTAEDLPLWCGDFDEYPPGGHEVPGGKCFSPETRLDKEELPYEEKEQYSPVSVLNFPFQQDEQTFSSFQHNHANIELNTGFHEDEEKAKQLLNHTKATSTLVERCETNVDHLLLDFFKLELSTSRKQIKGNEFDCEMLSVAKAWMSGEADGPIDWEMEGKKEVCVRDMEMGVNWSKFEEEQEEMGLEMESVLVSCLVDELLIDLLISQ